MGVQSRSVAENRCKEHLEPNYMLQILSDTQHLHVYRLILLSSPNFRLQLCGYLIQMARHSKLFTEWSAGFGFLLT